MSSKHPIVESARGLSTATVHEAARKTGALPSFIKPLAPHVTLYGRALPVHCPTGDNLFLHHAIYAAQQGEVMVVDCGDAREYGYWGEVMAVAAQAVDLAGLVIAGGVRDSRQMLALEFPVFAGNVCIRGTGKDPTRAGTVGVPIMIGDVTIRRGDLVIGDADGVMIIPWDKAEGIIAESRLRDDEEQQFFDQLREGKTTLEIYKLPPIDSET